MANQVHNVEFNADANALLQAAKKIAAEQLQIAESAIKVADAFGKLERVGNTWQYRMEQIKVLTEQGAQATIDLNEQLKKTAVAYSTNARQAERNAEAIRKIAEAQKEAATTARYQREASLFGSSIQRNVNFAGATRNELVDYKTAIGRLKEFMVANQISAKEMTAMWRNVASGKVKAFSDTYKQLQLLVNNAIGAEERLGEVTRKEQAKAAAAAAKHTAELQKQAAARLRLAQAQQAAFTSDLEKWVQRETSEIQRANAALHEHIFTWRGLARLAAVQVAHQAISSLASALRQGVQDAQNLEIAIAEVMTIDTSRSTFQSWAQVIRQASDTWGIDLADQIESAYEALSNQVVKSTSEFTAYINEVNRFAVVTKATADDSNNLLSSVINAYDLALSRTSQISAELFKAIDLGRFRAQEIANSLGNVIVPAEQLGISYQEVAASLAMMTIQGVKVTEAQTFLRNIMHKLIRPSEEMAKFFREIGVSSGEAAIATYGFAGLMGLIEQRTGGASDELGDLFQRIRAVTGAMAFAGQGLKDYEETLAKILASSDQYNRATSVVMENTGKRLQVEFNKISNFFKVDFGIRFIESISGLIGPIETLSDKVKTLSSVFINLAETVAILAGLSLIKALAQPAVAAGIALLELRTQATLLTAALASGQITLQQFQLQLAGLQVASVKASSSLAALGKTAQSIGIAIVIYQLVDLYNTYKESLNKTVEAITKDYTAWEKATQSRLLDEQREFNKLSDIYKNAQETRNKFFNQILAASIGSSNNIVDVEREQYENLEKLAKDYFNNLEKDIKESVKAWEDAASDYEKAIKRTRDAVENIQDSRGKSIFEWNLESITNSKVLSGAEKLVQQVALINNRIAELTADSDNAVFNLDDQQLTKITKEMENLAKKRVDLTQDAKTKGIFGVDLATQVTAYTDLLDEIQKKFENIQRIREQGLQLAEDQQKLEKQHLELTQQRAKVIEDFDFKSILQIEDINDFATKMQNQINLLDQIRRSQIKTQAPQQEIQNTAAQIDALIKLGNAQIAKLSAQQLQTQATDLHRQITEQQTFIDQNLNILQDTTLTKDKALRQIQDVVRAIAAGANKEFTGDGERGMFFDPRQNASFNLQDKLLQDRLNAINVIVANQGLTSDWAATNIRDLLLKAVEQVVKENNKLTGTSVYQLEQRRDIVTDTLNELAKKLSNAPQLEQSLQNAQQQLQTSQRQLAAIEQQIAAYGISTSATQNLSTIMQNTASTYQTYSQRLIQAIQANTVALQSRGFASGGYIPATDTIPAMLTPGEFVVNRASTQRFYTQLSAMNSGMRPQGYAQGGEVNVGGISIVVNESKTPTQTSQQIVREINRGLRQGAFKFRR